eukprot:m.232782 g.232782  ORF g.232782 m.232782 type:complete len:448 (-) comp18859_c0_seq1:27-1370(-)
MLPDTLLQNRQELPSVRKHLKGAIPSLPAATHEWISDKRERDQKISGCPPDLWLIHGKLYDLTPFLASHPGGAVWLELVRGYDCTVEFETHHLDESKTAPLLAKYYVRDCDKGTAAQAYTFEENGFYKSLKRALCAELKKHQTTSRPSLAMHILSGIAVSLYLLSFAWMLVAQSVPSAFVCGLFLYPLLGVGHNFFHQRDNVWMYAFDLSCFGSYHWRTSHAISHHHYPNLDLDIEATFVEPWMTFVRTQAPPRVNAFINFVIFTALIAPMEFIRRIVTFAQGGDPFRVEYLIPVAQWALALLLAGPGWGTLLLLLMYYVSNLLLVIISTPVHRSDLAWSAGCDRILAARADYGEHTVIATNDFSVSAGLFVKLFVFGSFNDHITHHLFPTLDLSKQYLARPLFLEHVKRFDVPYRVTRFPDMFKGLFRVLCRNPNDLCYVPPTKTE